MYKLIFSLILLSSSLLSNVDLIDIYRSHGIKEVEKIINKQLKSKKYWEGTLQDKNINNGYYESLKYVVMCNKKNKEIKVYDTKKDDVIYSSTVLIGKNSGNKVKEGDLKTPTGAYKIVAKLDKLDPFYGPFALESNYPNDFDRVLNKTGHGIWIHGVPYNEKRDPFTKGCIALPNKNLKTLGSSINIKKSILIISENKSPKVKKEDIAIILSEIYKWTQAWEDSDLEKYLSFYSKDFKRKDKSGIEQFKAYKKRIFEKSKYKTILFSDINIIPYPNDLGKKMFRITMHEDYKADNYKFVGKKILYVELVNNKMKILFE